MTWAFTDATNRVAYRVLDNGSMESCLAEALPAGTPIGPYAPPPPAVPQSVSRFQARAALFDAGLLAQVEDMMADAPMLAKLAWTDAQEFRRTSPTVAAMAQALGLDEAALDALFFAAAAIEA